MEVPAMCVLVVFGLVEIKLFKQKEGSRGEFLLNKTPLQINVLRDAITVKFRLIFATSIMTSVSQPPIS